MKLINKLKNLFVRKLETKTDETFEEMLMRRCEYQYNLVTKCQVPNDVDPTSFYMGFICGAKELAKNFKDT